MFYFTDIDFILQVPNLDFQVSISFILQVFQVSILFNSFFQIGIYFTGKYLFFYFTGIPGKYFFCFSG